MTYKFLEREFRITDNSVDELFYDVWLSKYKFDTKYCDQNWIYIDEDKYDSGCNIKIEQKFIKLYKQDDKIYLIIERMFSCNYSTFTEYQTIEL